MSFESDVVKRILDLERKLEVTRLRAVPIIPLTTKGDLLGHDGSVLERLGVGTTGYFLKADSAQSLGMTWVDMLPGWLDPHETWTYASASTINVPSGAASRYAVGGKVRFYQTTTRQFYITAVADTLLTLNAGSDFSVANAIITNNLYSPMADPIGFPREFNLTTPTWTALTVNFTNQPATAIAAFTIANKLIYIRVVARCHATSGGTGIFRATFTAGQLPANGGNYYGDSANLSWSRSGHVNRTAVNQIDIALYDGTTLAGNSEYFRFSCVSLI